MLRSILDGSWYHSRMDLNPIAVTNRFVTFVLGQYIVDASSYQDNFENTSPYFECDIFYCKIGLSLIYDDVGY